MRVANYSDFEVRSPRFPGSMILRLRLQGLGPFCVSRAVLRM